MCLLSRDFAKIFLAQCCIISFMSAENPFKDQKVDYASSTEDMKILVKHEYKIIKLLSTLAKQSARDRDYSSVLCYIADYHSSLLKGIGAERSLISIENLLIMDGDQLAEEVVNHALMTYRCIRRIVLILPEIEAEFNKHPIEEDIVIKLNSLKDDIPYPVEEDLDTAISSVIRLKQIYSVNIDDIVNGIIGELHTNSGLKARQCYEIGLYAFEGLLYSHAIDFLDKALRMEKDKYFPFTTLEIEDIETKLAHMMKEHDRKLQSGLEDSDYKFDSMPYFFDGFLKERGSENFQNRVAIKIDSTMEAQEVPIALISKFQKLCRGEDLRVSESKKNLRCYLESRTNPVWIISPLKIEVLHEDPLVIQIYDVLSHLKMKELQLEVKEELRRSRTVSLDGDTKGGTSPYRTSSNSWVLDFNVTKFQYLGKKVGRIVNLDLSKFESSENLQIANYAPGGHYVPHTDAIFEKEFVHLINSVELQRGDRIATFMIYLSNVEAGGYTVFPKLKISVKPVKGSAVFWYNVYSDGSINHKMLHAGCPVLYGQKWIANKWVRSNDQMFLRKCPLIYQFDTMNLELNPKY